MRYATAILAGLLLSCSSGAPEPGVRHLTVFQETGRFAAWPANHGMWQWDNEILFGFDNGEFEFREQGHAINREKPVEQMLARSLDGGETWTIERPEDLRLPPGIAYQRYPPGEGRPIADCEGGIDFTHPDFAFTARMTGNPGTSRFYHSSDRGRTWAGPCRLPDFGHGGSAARTDYLVNGKHDLFLFTTLAKSNGKEGRVAATRTRDGGKTWTLEGYVGPEPPETDYSIMPATQRVGPTALLTLVRHRGFIDAWRSEDDGKTWTYANRPAPDTGSGNPPSLIRLSDGRLLLTYGYRKQPFGIRARFSSDDGATWSDERILRDDGGNGDIGYPRSAQRPDGQVVTVYYYHLENRERSIEATIWRP